MRQTVEVFYSEKNILITLSPLMFSSPDQHSGRAIVLPSALATANVKVLR